MTDIEHGAAQAGGTGMASSRVRNLPAKEAAAYMGITMRELKGLRARRALPFYRIGHRTVTYSPKDLDTFLDKCRIAPAGESIGHAA